MIPRKPCCFLLSPTIALFRACCHDYVPAWPDRHSLFSRLHVNIALENLLLCIRTSCALVLYCCLVAQVHMAGSSSPHPAGLQTFGGLLEPPFRCTTSLHGWRRAQLLIIVERLCCVGQGSMLLPERQILVSPAPPARKSVTIVLTAFTKLQFCGYEPCSGIPFVNFGNIP